MRNRVGIAVWAIAAVYLAFFVTRGWIPSDEGLLGQAAERVLRGELPHRDFDDPYTGLLTFWHALAFRLLGVELASLRIFLYAAALAFVPVTYAVARRAAPPWPAAAATLFCVAWSLPCYFASMPSWYNLFLAAGGVLALLRHVETGRARWLAVAGACGGVSFLFKSVGLLFVAAALLFFVYREQTLAEREPPTARRGFSAFVTLGLALFAVSLALFIALRPRPLEIVLFTVPGITLAGFLVWNEWRRRRAPGAARARCLAAMAAAFLAGFTVPVGLFLIPYAASSDLGAILDPRVFLAAKRVEFSSFPLPAAWTAAFVLPLAALWTLPWLSRRAERIDRRLAGPAALAAVLVLAFGSNRYVYQMVWFTLRPAVPALVAVGLVLLMRRRADLAPARRQGLFLALAAAAMTSMVQFPYHWGLYFLYAAPLVAVAWLFFIAGQKETEPAVPWRLHLTAMAFYFLFALVWLDFGRVQVQGIVFDPRVTSAYLDVDRGGLWVEPEKADLYERLVDEIRRRSAEGAYVYATPDCPEVYFLSGRRNPTPTFFDYFDDDYGTPERTARLLELLDERRIDVVVLHWNPSFSALAPDFAAAVFERFPHRLPLYPLFTLHWRQRAAEELTPRKSSAAAPDG